MLTKILVSCLTLILCAGITPHAGRKKTITMALFCHSNNNADPEKTSISIRFVESMVSTIKYKNPLAIAYAKKYSKLNDNICGVYNNNPQAKLSDCAHFIAHCLNAGGIEIKAATPNTTICPHGLCYRVEELTAALAKLSQTYSNVTQIGISDAIVGDFGFFKIPVIRPTHAFMICQPAAKTDDITIYSHTTNRSCAKPEPSWYQFFDVAYRITDGTEN